MPGTDAAHTPRHATTRRRTETWRWKEQTEQGIRYSKRQLVTTGVRHVDTHTHTHTYTHTRTKQEKTARTSARTPVLPTEEARRRRRRCGEGKTKRRHGEAHGCARGREEGEEVGVLSEGEVRHVEKRRMRWGEGGRGKADAQAARAVCCSEQIGTGDGGTVRLARVPRPGGRERQAAAKAVRWARHGVARRGVGRGAEEETDSAGGT